MTVWLSPGAAKAWKAKPNGRRGWKKLHLGVDATGEIVVQVLTDSRVDDEPTGVAITDDVVGAVR